MHSTVFVAKRTDAAYYTPNAILRSSFMKEKDKYSEPKTFNYPNAVVKVYFPILTEEERKRRMAQIAESAARLLQSKSK